MQNHWIFWIDLKSLGDFFKIELQIYTGWFVYNHAFKTAFDSSGLFCVTYADLLIITIFSAIFVVFEFNFTVLILLWETSEQEKDERGTVLCATYRDKAAFAVVAGSTPAAFATVLLHDSRLVLFAPKFRKKSRLWLWLDAYARPPSVHRFSVVLFLNDVFHDM